MVKANEIVQLRKETLKPTIKITESQRINASQNRRQRENELAEIDEEMDKLVAAMDADFDEVE